MPRTWTERMTIAAEYVESYLRRGWRMTDALHDYAQGGGVIRADEWAILWRSTRDASARWEYVQRFGPDFVPPESFFLDRDFRYQQTYVYNFEFTPLFRETTPEGERWIEGAPIRRQVEFDQPVSYGEAIHALEEAADRWGKARTSPVYRVGEVRNVKLYKRTG